MIASKYLYDDGEEEEVFNSEFASCANLPVLKVNQAEKLFLNAIEWEIFVEPNLFYKELLRIETLVMQLECRKRSHQTVTYAELHRFLNNDRIFQLIAVHIAKQMLRTVVLYSITYAGIVLGTLITTICVLNARLLSLHLVSQSASHCNQTLTHLSNQPTLFESSTTDRTLKWDHFKYSLDSKIVITNHRSAFKRAEKTQQGLKEALQQSQHHHQQQQPRHNQFRQFVAQMLSNHNLTRELFQTPVIKTPMLFNLFDSRLELI